MRSEKKTLLLHALSLCPFSSPAPALASVLALLAKMTETLKDEATPLPALRMMDEGGQATSERRLFGVPGVIAVEGVPNMLMMGATPSPSEPVVLIELMYIDPEQFAQSDARATSSNS